MTSVRRPPELDARDAAMVSMYQSGFHPVEIGKRYGLTRKGAYSAIVRYLNRGAPDQAILAKPAIVPMSRDRIFCNQCDRNVLIAESKACRSRFCKAAVA